MAGVQNSHGPCPQWSFNSSTNQLNTSQGFAYDAAGNLTTEVWGTSNRNYSWDAEGRLYKVVDNTGAGTSTTYTYNALGQRAELLTTGWQLEQIFDTLGQRVGYYQVVSGGNVWVAAYVPWRGRELAAYSTGNFFAFFHANALGSASVATWPGGGPAGDLLFYPWGQLWQQWPNRPYDEHFAGMHASLQGSSLVDWTMYDAPYRFYGSNLGRWHSPDPLGGDITNPQSLNRYAYVMNNPTSLTDPRGLQMQHCPAADTTASAACTGLAPSGGDLGWGLFALSELAAASEETVAYEWGVINDLTTAAIYNLYTDGTIFPELVPPAEWGVIGEVINTPDAGIVFAATGSARNSSSWGWNFTKAFFGGLVSSAGWKAVGHSLVDQGGCDNLMFSTFADVFNPLPGAGPGASDVAELAPNAVAGAGQAAASAYSVYQGLIVPLRSSIYRSLQSSTLGYAATLGEALPYLQAGYAGGKALAITSMAAYNGECH